MDITDDGTELRQIIAFKLQFEHNQFVHIFLFATLFTCKISINLFI